MLGNLAANVGLLLFLWIAFRISPWVSLIFSSLHILAFLFVLIYDTEFLLMITPTFEDQFSLLVAFFIGVAAASISIAKIREIRDAQSEF